MHTTSSGLPWSIRAVQLDLARQMETVEFVCGYADAAASWGFNTLFLYLEGRVATKTFPYRSAAESYTLDDMARIVAHAGRAGIEVVPGISALGHAEHFFSCAEMAHLAEERDGRSRFGGDRPVTFCPSLPETVEFLEGYLADLSEVFTGPDVHVGCDEAWNLGFCDLCAARWEEQGLGTLFREHIQRLNEVCSRLGKRMWIWDDLYELFPEELERTSRDVVMCHWNYDDDIETEGCQAHFANRWRQDWLAEYQRLGFPVLVCPNGAAPQNTAAFTDYARRQPVLGGLLTQWEMANRFHEECAPSVAFTGRLWSQSPFDVDRAWAEAITAVVPGADPPLARAVQELCTTSRSYPRASLQAYLTGGMSAAERRARSSVTSALSLLRLARQDHPPTDGLETLDDLDLTARIELLHWDLRSLLPKIYDPRRPSGDVPLLSSRLGACQEELEELIDLCAPLHEARRPNMHPVDRAAENLRGVHPLLEAAVERLARESGPQDWWLVLRLFLPDQHGAPRLSVSARRGEEALPLVEGSFKPAGLMQGCYYTIQVPFEMEGGPDAIRLEVCGYGGQGIAFLEVQNCSDVLLPNAIRTVVGSVEHPQAVLRDDSQWAYLGNKDIAAAMHCHRLAEEPSILELELAPR